MAIKKWKPLKDLELLQKRLDKFFEDPFFPLASRFFEESLMEGEWQPAVDISEDKNNFYINAEIPGMKKEDIKIEIQGDQLVISGERKLEKEEKKENYHRIERYYGNFCRSFVLPDTVAKDKISATYKDGILQIKLPKTEKAKPKAIEIKVD